MPQLRYYSLHSTFYDLGLYFNQLHNYKIENFHSGHLNIFVPVLALLYQLMPVEISPQIMLLLQSLGLLFACYLTLIWFGGLPAFLMFLSYPIWFANISDFHYEFISIILFLFFYKSLIRNSLIPAIFAIILLGLTKEIYFITCVFCGIMVLIQAIDNRRNTKFAIAIFSVSLIGLIISFQYVYNRTSVGVITIGSGYDWLGVTIFEKIYFLISNPFTVLYNIISNYRKLAFLILPFLAFAFLPLKAIKYLIPVIPTFAIALLSGNPLHYRYNSHYQGILVVPFVVATHFALLDCQLNSKHFRAIVFASITVFLCFSPAPFSVLFSTDSFGYKQYVMSSRDNAIKNAMRTIDTDFPDAYFITQNNLIYNANINRPVLSAFPENLDASKNDTFVFVDYKRKMYLNDITCSNDCDKFNNELKVTYRILESKYYVYYENDGFVIYRSKSRV